MNPDSDLNYNFLPANLLTIINSNEYFMMEQYSDIKNAGMFQHVVFLGLEKIKNIFSKSQNYAKHTNTVVSNVHTQIFIEKDYHLANINKFDNLLHIVPSHNTNQYIYKVEKLDNILSGFIKVDNYFILANSTNESFNVYSFLNDKTKTGISYICLVKLGKLINPLGLQLSTLNIFQKNYNLQLCNNVVKYLLETSIIKYENQLFHIDLETKSKKQNPAAVFAYLNQSNINNFAHEEQIQQILLTKNTDKDYNDKLELILDDEKKYMKNLFNGLIFVGIIKNEQHLKSSNLLNLPVYANHYSSLYLLVNSTDLKLSGSIWKYTENDPVNGLSFNDKEYIIKKSLELVAFIK